MKLIYPNLVLLLMCAYFFYILRMKREAFEEPKFPVSEFTLQYIMDNASNTCANTIFGKIQVADRGSVMRVPTPIQGTLLDQPRTYQSSWLFA